MSEPSEQMYIPLEGIGAATASMEKTPTGAMKAQLRDIGDKVNDIAAHMGQRDELAVLMADCRTTMTEAAGVLHSQLSDVVMYLQHLDAKQGTAVAAQEKQGWLALLRTHWLLPAVGCAIGMVLMGATWKLWPTPSYQPLLTAVDRTLVAQWVWLPKGVKEDLAAEYRRYGFETPATRTEAKR